MRQIMRNLNKSITFKNIFFDFDGVLAESVRAKTEAFHDIYLPFGKDIAAKVVQHHLHHGGMSRFEKFKIYHEQYLGQFLSVSQAQILANRFSEMVLNKVIDSDEVPGSVSFLKQYHKKLNFWIITGTPTSEIEIIIKERGLNTYFKGSYGSPETKSHWTEFLIKEHDLQRKETLFLGDATTDYEAAQGSRIHFALRDHQENDGIFINYDGLRFKDFNELEAQIENCLE